MLQISTETLSKIHQLSFVWHSHLIDADFSLHVLQALLNDADEGSRGNQSTIDVGLADVTLYTKGKC